MGKSLTYRAINSLKKGVSRVRGMMTRNKADYVDTSVGVARPAGFKSSVGAVNNAGSRRSINNKFSRPTSDPKSKAAFEASTKGYAGKNWVKFGDEAKVAAKTRRSNRTSRSTSDPKSKAAFQASTRAYAMKHWEKF